MRDNVSRALIETIVKRSLQDVRDSPERNVRNLVDMALLFSSGRFQRNFFETAQSILQNESSAYYSIIRDIAFFVSGERLLSIGINLGYNSLIMGTEKIRAVERDFSVPWSLFLEIDGASWQDRAECYDALIKDGKRLGVFCWLIAAGAKPETAISLAKKNPNHAFVIFCTPYEITPELLAEAGTVWNIMFAVQWNESAQNACQSLRERRFLYSVYHQYCEDDVEEILNGEILACTENLHPLFTILYPSPHCNWKTRETVYERILQLRIQQQYKTVPWDLYFDNLYIDKAISGKGHVAGFDREGVFHCLPARSDTERYSLFDYSLPEILHNALPKEGGAEP